MFASLVLYSHATTLGDFGSKPLSVFSQGQETIGSIALGCFFILSGFLVTASYSRSSSLPRFLWQRVLRIMPAFWVCLVVTAAAFGTLHFAFQHHSLEGYWAAQPDSPFGYVRNNFFLTQHQNSIAGQPASGARAGLFNASLWTLPLEFICYLAIGVLGALGIFNARRRFAAPVICAALIFCLMGDYAPELTSQLGLEPSLRKLMIYFLSGSLFFCLHARMRMQLWLFALSSILVIVSIRFPALFFLRPWSLTYVVMWLGERLPLRKFGTRNDCSYGLYIYGYPWQQTLTMLHANQLGLVSYLGLSLAGAASLGWLSYRYIEEPCLRLKRWQPRRPQREAVDAAAPHAPYSAESTAVAKS